MQLVLDFAEPYHHGHDLSSEMAPWTRGLRTGLWGLLARRASRGCLDWACSLPGLRYPILMKVPPYWNHAKAHLRASDPILAAVIDAHEEPPLRSKGRVFETLVHAIVGQQISAKAASAVWGRLVALLKAVTPEQISRQPVAALRGVGLSGRKVEYIKGLADNARWLDTLDWTELDDDAVRKKLVSLRGVGPWTAEMVLIFTLLRPDVLPLGDIGVIRAVEQLYAGGASLTKDKVAEIAASWAPYRTVGVWYLWRHIDADPVEY